MGIELTMMKQENCTVFSKAGRLWTAGTWEVLRSYIDVMDGDCFHSIKL